MKTLPPHLKRKLLPLLLSLAAGQACAVEVLVVGGAGLSGAAGAAPGLSGADGVSAPAVFGGAGPGGAGTLVLAAYGGQGGDGGAGGGPAGGIFAGNGGTGGHGAAASGTVSSTAAALDVAVQSLVFGGYGGRGGAAGGVGTEGEGGWLYSPYSPAFGMGGIGGDGGAASAVAYASTSGAGNVEVKAVARGGDGGAVEGQAGRGGAGGAAGASAFGQSDTGKVSVSAEAYGGNGGAGDLRRRGAGGSAGGVELVNAVAGRTQGQLVLAQHAEGGASGGGAFAYDDQGNPLGQQPVRVGDASSQLTLSDAEASMLSATVSARGGNTGAFDNYSAYEVSTAGGAARAGLTLASTRAGAAVDGTVAAYGGAGGGQVLYTTGAGGLAEAVARLTGLGDVRGSAAAFGGTGGSAWEGSSAPGGQGGDARADLGLTGAGLVEGYASAYGGQTGSGSFYWGTPLRGQAYATLELVGGGARGNAYAEGANAGSGVTVRSSGAQAVDVAASAQVNSGYGGANASVYVESGVGAAPAGAAKVTAAAYARTADSLVGPASAALEVKASGDIYGVSLADSGNTYYGWASGPASSGSASSSARGVTSGGHAVLLGASARAGDVEFVDFTSMTSGAASAQAYGQSGSGTVEVNADARAGGGSWVHPHDGYGHASASATAVNLTRGGQGTARASVWGGSADVLASAGGVGKAGTAVRVSGSAATLASLEWQQDVGRVVTGSAAAANYFDAQGFQLAWYDGGGTRIVSNVSMAPEGVADVAGPGTAVTAAMGALVGVGMQALGTDMALAGWGMAPGLLTASGQFGFDGVSGQHLLVGFVSASFAGGFDTLELSITNNGVGLFSRLFTSADDAMLFFSDHVLDLGLFGAGAQDVRVSSIYSYYQPGAFAFNYVVGSGAAVAAVPEASSWLMLVLGLGTMVIVARRRRA